MTPWAQQGTTKRTRGDRRLQEVGAGIRQTFEPVVMGHLYPRSEILINVQVLSADGGESSSSSLTSSLKLSLVDERRCVEFWR